MQASQKQKAAVFANPLIASFHEGLTMRGEVLHLFLEVQLVIYINQAAKLLCNNAFYNLDDLVAFSSIH